MLINTNINKERLGELYTLGDTLIMSLFPIVSIYALTSLSPLYLAGSSMLVGGIFAFIVSFFSYTRNEILFILKWKHFWPSIISCIISFSAYFIGLSYSNAINVSILGNLEIFFTFIFFGLILKTEKYSKYAILGGITILIGSIYALYKEFVSLYFGDLIIVISALSFTVGSWYSQSARRLVSSNTIFATKYTISGVILLGVAILFDPIPSFNQWKDSILFIIFNGVLAFWITKIILTEAMHRIPIAKILLLGSTGTIFTMIWSYMFFSSTPSQYQIVGYLIVVCGVYIIIRNKFLK